jgi:hypothetical protein
MTAYLYYMQSVREEQAAREKEGAKKLSFTDMNKGWQELAPEGRANFEAKREADLKRLDEELKTYSPAEGYALFLCAGADCWKFWVEKGRVQNGG